MCFSPPPTCPIDPHGRHRSAGVGPGRWRRARRRVGGGGRLDGAAILIKMDDSQLFSQSEKLEKGE